MEQMIQSLNDLQREIDTMKVDKAKSQGVIQNMETNLKEMDIESLEEGKKKIKSYEKKMANLLETLEDGFLELRKTYDW